MFMRGMIKWPCPATLVDAYERNAVAPIIVLFEDHQLTLIHASTSGRQFVKHFSNPVTFSYPVVLKEHLSPKKSWTTALDNQNGTFSICPNSNGYRLDGVRWNDRIENILLIKSINILISNHPLLYIGLYLKILIKWINILISNHSQFI